MLKTKIASGVHHFRPGTHTHTHVCMCVSVVWEIHVAYTQATLASAIHLVEGGGWYRGEEEEEEEAAGGR